MANLNSTPASFLSRHRLFRFFTPFLFALTCFVVVGPESRAAAFFGNRASINQEDIPGLSENNLTVTNAGQENVATDICGTAAALIETIQGLSLNAGVKNALIVKLNNALESFATGNNNAAINQLNAFINQVEAKRGNPLTNAEADYLIAGANAMIAAIQNGTAVCGGPELQCPGSLETYCDLTQNNNLLWNQSYWWDDATGSHDLCEGDASLTITATDASSGDNLNITYLLSLDLDGDGVMETVIDSDNPPAPGTVNYNGVTPQVFDGRPVPADDIYRWANHQSVSGTSRTATVQWKTLAQMPTPGNPLGTPGIAPQLPYGTHKIEWTVTDGSGNEASCEYLFDVKDCKKPTVVCINGLSVNIMPTGMVTVWATDFLQYTEDNCTPANLIQFGIRKSGQGTGFPVDGDNNPITGVTFDCNELGYQLVELWAMDLAGNADYCETYVDVQDNIGLCRPGNKVNAAGDGLEPLSGPNKTNGPINGSAGQPDIELFPNPAGSEVNIQLYGLKSSGVLTIFDPLGSAVWEQPVENGMAALKINLADNAFASGVYMVSLRVENEVVTRRLVVLR